MVQIKFQPLFANSHLKRQKRRIQALNQNLSRKQKSSSRWKKTRLALAKTHEHVAACREAGLRELAQLFAQRYAIFCIEDLVLAFMLQNRYLAETAHDVGLGRLMTLLEQAFAKRGHLLLKAPRFAATTQTCPCCGYKNRELKNNLKIRRWVCPSCHAEHDRDVAAAQNILVMALQAFQARLQGAESGSLDLLSLQECQGLHPELADAIAREGSRFVAPLLAKAADRYGTAPKSLASGDIAWASGRQRVPRTSASSARDGTATKKPG